MSDVPEAPLEERDGGLVPTGPGWFVVNAREAQWIFTDEMGSAVVFEGREEGARFPQVGINIQVLRPGQPNCMYHGENAQEAFLVLSGEPVLIIEGEERQLRPWDFVHCPPWAEHVFVGAGDGPSAILMIGARPETEELIYPRNEAALRHGAGVEQDTPNAEEAYARFERPAPGPYRDGALPGA
jgi:uncharacterized cupin superfamily protein